MEVFGTKSKLVLALEWRDKGRYQKRAGEAESPKRRRNGWWHGSSWWGPTGPSEGDCAAGTAGPNIIGGGGIPETQSPSENVATPPREPMGRISATPAWPKVQDVEVAATPLTGRGRPGFDSTDGESIRGGTVERATR